MEGFQVTVLFMKNEMQYDQQPQSFEGDAQVISMNGMALRYILSSRIVSCYDTEGIFEITPRNGTEISAASSAMVQVTVYQGHPRDHLPKTAGNDVLTISKNGIKVTEILTPSTMVIILKDYSRIVYLQQRHDNPLFH